MEHIKIKYLLAFFLLYTCVHAFAENVPALAAPGDKGALMKQYEQSMNDLALLGEAVEDYTNHHGKPPEAESLDELLDQDVGNGMTFAAFFMDETPPRDIPRKDPWGNHYLYQHGENKFQLAAAGSDGQFGGFDQSGPYIKSGDMEGKDIILSNGRFIVFPMDHHLFKRWYDDITPSLCLF